MDDTIHDNKRLSGKLCNSFCIVCKVIVYIYDCLLFYHIETTLKGNVPCGIGTIDIDDMVVFRTV